MNINHRHNNQNASSSSTSSCSQIQLRHLSLNITKEHIYDIFQHFGSIQQIIVPHDEITGFPLTYAYIDYVQREDAIEAIESMNNGIIDGKQVTVLLKHS